MKIGERQMKNKNKETMRSKRLEEPWRDGWWRGLGEMDGRRSYGGTEGGRSHSGVNGRQELIVSQETARRKATYGGTEGRRSHGGPLVGMLGDTRDITN